MRGEVTVLHILTSPHIPHFQELEKERDSLQSEKVSMMQVVSGGASEACVCVIE